MMKKSIIYCIVMLCMFSSSVIIAQEEIGSGDTIYAVSFGSVDQVESNLNGSLYYCRNIYCSTFAGMQSMAFIGIDWSTGYFAPNIAGSLAADWMFSNNNQILTVNLKDNLVWSDGTPITAADVMMSYELGLVADANYAGEAGVTDLNNIFQEVEALDDYTIQITFTEGTCNVIFNVNRYLRVLPAHIYRDLIDEVGYAELRNHPYFTNLSQSRVVAGAFQIEEIVRDEEGNMQRFVYVRNERYTDNSLGYVAPERIVYDGYFDSEYDDLVQQFLEGDDVSFLLLRPEYIDQFIGLSETDEFQLARYFNTNWNFLALNRADPTNPQPAVDEEGNRIDQGLHPIFGDVQVRRAVARAIDVDRAIDEALEGYGIRMTSYVLAGAWSYHNELPPIPYDPEMALEMLAGAGWLPENSELPASVDNRLVCRDCLYAREVDENYNGSYLEFDAMVEDLAPRNVLQTEIARENLAEIGITMTVRVVEISELVEGLLGQTYDAVMIGFTSAAPYQPDSTRIFGATADQPERGFNFTSFYDEGYYALEQTASTIPGCGYTERIALYHQMQEIIQDDVPLVIFGNAYGFVAAQNWIHGFEPYQNAPTWNIDTWRIIED